MNPKQQTTLDRMFDERKTNTNNDESYDEFLRRTHCAHISTDELMMSLYETRGELKRAKSRIATLENKLATDSQNFEIECLKATIEARDKQIQRLSPLLDAATKECISARLRGLSKKHIEQFWRAFIPQSLDELTISCLPAIRNILDSLEKQQRGSIFDIKHEDPCGFGHE